MVVKLAGGTGNAIQGNSIHSNGGLGIDLAADDILTPAGPTEDGVTPNDEPSELDVDAGPNNLQNFPVISLVEASASSTRVVGFLDSLPSLLFTIEFFANTESDNLDFDGERFGEGERFLGSTTVTTDALGHADFDVTLGEDSGEGEVFSVTATDPDGNTSEFSKVFNPPPAVQSVDVGTDLTSLLVQLNDDDLDSAGATDVTNYKVIAATGDADGDGDPFNDGDELELAIGSIAYDQVTDRITVNTADVLFEDIFRLEMDGDDVAADGTPGISDVNGAFLAGGDFTVDLDLTSLGMVEALIDKVEGLGLDIGPVNSLMAKLDAALNQLGTDSPNENGVIAKLNAFIKGVNHWFDKGEIAADDRDELVADAELIILGITLLENEPIL